MERFKELNDKPAVTAKTVAFHHNMRGLIASRESEFAEAAKSSAGYEGLIQAAKAMAMMAVDLLAVPENVAQVRAAFEQQKAEQAHAE